MLLIVAMWGALPIVAGATTDGAMMAPDAIPFAKHLYMLMWSSWGAVASMLHRFSNGFEGTRMRVILVVLADTSSATLAGMLAFLGGLHFGVAPMLVPVLVAVCAYGGARTLDAFWMKLMSKVSEK